jgi:SPP1 gp7 family putative phage head morphogenesis protein
MYGKHWTNLKAQLAEEYANVNRTALAYINGRLPEVYALNYNDIGAELDDKVKGYSFELVDAQTVKNLATKDETLLPYKYLNGVRDVRWNTQKVNAAVLQGILQGESIPNMAKRLQSVTNMNKVSAIRNARTAVTGAECKGRQDSYARAEADGIILQKEWLATNDGRTRHSHAALDGAIVDQDKKFDNGLMYPGDPSGRPEEVYNCRCTLVAKVNGFKKVQVQKAMAQQAQPPATTEDAIRTAHDLGVKYAQFEKMPLEQVNNAIDAVRTLPKDCVPKVIASGKDVSTVTGRPLGRKADQWWGVTYDYRTFSLRTMQLGYDATDFDGGLIVGLNTQKFKTLDALTKAKKATNDAYFAKTGRYWSFNTDGKATAYHEIGHCFADVRGLPNGWEDASARWAEESACDLLKKPDEAFAEAWAAYHLGDKRLPNYISAIIGGLK